MRVTTAGKERRRFGRIQLDSGIPATFAEQPVRVIELSMTGFKIAHEARFGGTQNAELAMNWEGQPVLMLCNIVRTTLHRLAKQPGEKSLYHSGLRIVATAGDADTKLREMIAERVIRALEEQKANARGIPPLAAYTYQLGKGDRYRRCELVEGKWRKSETTRAVQPLNGFTISAEVDADQVELLCRTYESTNAEGRRLTQMLAQLSISKEEGIPTRRYVP